MKTALSLAFVLASVSSWGQALNLGWTPKAGDTNTYSLKMDTVLYGDMARISSTLTQKINEVQKDGSYVVEIKQGGMVARIGKDDALVKDTESAIQTVYSTNGSVVEQRGKGVTEKSYRVSNLSAFRRPDKPVAIGESYTVEIKSDKKTGVRAATATYKVEKEEKLKNDDTVVVTFTYKETEANDSAGAIGTAWLRKSDGLVLKMDSNWTNAPIPFAPSPMSIHYVYEWVAAG